MRNSPLVGIAWTVGYQKHESLVIRGNLRVYESFGEAKGKAMNLQWTPFSKPPKEKQLILTRLEENDVKATIFYSRLLQYNKGTIPLSCFVAVRFQ
jgi:hypothetical protein